MIDVQAPKRKGAPRMVITIALHFSGGGGFSLLALLLALSWFHFPRVFVR